MTVLIDSNIVLDFVLKREPFAQAAFDCIDRLILDQAKNWLTASTITDIYYVTRRTLKDAAAAKDVIAKLLGAFQIANVDKNDCLNALDVDTDDYEDALASICAKKVKADFIVTRNPKHFTASPVPAISPEEMLGKLN